MQNLRRVLNELPSSSVLDSAAIKAYVQLVGEDQTWNADVIRIANGIDPATRTVPAIAGTLLNPNRDQATEQALKATAVGGAL